MNEPQWAILQLRDGLDPISAEDIERDLRARWPKVVCRFPALKQGVVDFDNPLSAYIFVRTPVSRKIENSQFAMRLLREPTVKLPNGRFRVGGLQKVSESELRLMAPNIELPEPGVSVRVTAGDWAGLEGVVVESSGTAIKVLVELWSRKRLLKLEPSEFQLA